MATGNNPSLPGRTDAEITARFGMAIFLGTWVMLFAALFFAYAVVRAKAPSWPPGGAPALPRGLPGVATLMLVASGLVLRRGLAKAQPDAAQPLIAAGAITGLFGVGFLAVQVQVWRQVTAAGLHPGSSTYGSVFYALTIFHALHVVVGLALLGLLVARAARARGAAPAPTLQPVRLAASFWDFVTVVWVITYLTVYVL